MKLFLRFIAMCTLGAFLGLTVLESVHHHPQAKAESQCSVCKVTHQTPSLISPQLHQDPHLIEFQNHTVFVSQPYILFVFASHGLSPPSLLG